VKAVVLAGGLGMRLQPYTTIVPKPLFPVGEVPIIEVILRRLRAHGFETVDVCLGHLGELIQAYFAETSKIPDGLQVHWHREREPLGTAGALSTVGGLDATFLAMNGDILTTLDLGALLEFHVAAQAALTVAMRREHVDIGLGVIEAVDGRVTAYREKPALDLTVSMGVYVYEPRALEHLPGGPCQFPELVQRLLDAGEHVAAYESDAEWFDIGTFEDHERAARFVDRHPGILDA